MHIGENILLKVCGKSISMAYWRELVVHSVHREKKSVNWPHRLIGLCTARTKFHCGTSKHRMSKNVIGYNYVLPIFEWVT